MRRFLIALCTLCLLLAGTAQAKEDKDWGGIAELDGGMKIHGRYGSFQRYDGAASMVVRFTKNNNVAFFIVGISDKDCDAGYGQITLFDTNWNVIKKDSYVAKGGNGSAYIGDLLCFLINRQKGQNL